MQSKAEVYAHIGKRLRELRLDRDMTQAQVAEIVGVSPQQYQKYEDAQSKSSVAMLMALSSHYGVRYESFLPGWDGSETAPETETPPAAAKSGLSDLGKDPLTTRLVSAFLEIPDQDERLRLVELVEAMRKAHSR